MIPKSTFDAARAQGTPKPDGRIAAIAGIALLAFVLVAVFGDTACHPAEVVTWPPDGPSEIFGVSESPELPEPIVCPEPPPCPGCTFLSRFVYRLDVESANPREVRDVLHRAFVESRYTPATVSETGDYGICQINADAHPETDADRLLVDPEYAAVECLRAYRDAYRACGKKWECCYQRGIRGCRNGGK